ncbi:MAG: hypothetical protein WAQ25_05090 [Candidatus Saccharimonas sp.]
MGLLSSRFNAMQPKTLHTNAMAEISADGKLVLGAASPETFEQRRRIDRNRQHIQSFRSAGIVHGYRTEARSQSPTTVQRPSADKTATQQAASPEPTTILGKREAAQTARLAPSRQAFNATLTPAILPHKTPDNTRATTQRFREPPSRGYNPFG